jgi:hypothetical protein
MASNYMTITCYYIHYMPLHAAKDANDFEFRRRQDDDHVIVPVCRLAVPQQDSEASFNRAATPQRGKQISFVG